MTESPTLADAARRAALEDFERVATCIRDDITRTPLVRHSDGARSIRLKAECLQPLGSFKIRAAAGVLRSLPPDVLRSGVVTASAGNFAQGLAHAARRRGIPLTVHVPDSAPRVKVEAVRALGGKVVAHPFADWWTIMSSRCTGADEGTFIHPVCELGVILGNGTLGLELAAEWPDVDTVVVPFGGGGLASGIALALKAASKRTRIVACEIETAASLAAAFAAGQPVHIDRRPSFVDGIGSNSVLQDMWPLIRELVDDVIVVTLNEARAALRELALRHHLVAEGAGAVALAAALHPRCGGTRVAAIISGGNIEAGVLAEILTQSQT